MACALGWWVPASVGAQEVVVHPKVVVERLTRNEARAIFGMKLRQWPDGRGIVVFVLPDDSPTHLDFVKSRLGIFPQQLRYAWDRMVFSGTGQAPVEVDSEEALRARVASTPGAVGYLRRDMVDGSVRVTPLR